MSRSNTLGSPQQRRLGDTDRDGKFTDQSDIERRNRDLVTSFPRKAIKPAEFTLRSPASSVYTDATSPSSSNETVTEIHDFTGWTSSPRLRDGWASRTTLNTNHSIDSPITPISPVDNTCPFRRGSSPSPILHADVPEVPSVPLSLPIRLKEEDEATTPPLRLISALEALKDPPPRHIGPIYEKESHGFQEPSSPTRQDDESTSIQGDLVEDDVFTSIRPSPYDPAEGVLRYSLRETLGFSYADLESPLVACNAVVRNFISDIRWAFDQDTSAFRQAGGVHRNSTNASSSTTVTRSSQHSSTSSSLSDKGKRKANNNTGNDNNDEDEFDGNQINESRRNLTKRAKLEKTLRMSCPYRKKNPLRFNVRDYRLCALTVFDNTSELRRHIQDCHRRPTVSPRACQRCRVEFASTDELRQHVLYLTGVCPVNEDFIDTHDLEDGIDEETAEKLRTKKGRVSDPVDVQWGKIWELLFPGIPVESYDYCAVMEHFELHQKYCNSIPSLKENLRVLGLGGPGLETLGNILDNHIIGLFEECNEEGRKKYYRNRQPKTQASPLSLPRSKQSSLRRRLNRDSACEMVLEEDSGLSEQKVPEGSLNGISRISETTMSREHTVSQGPSPQPYSINREASQLIPLTSFEPLPPLNSGGQDMINDQSAFLGIGSVPDLNEIGVHQWNEPDYGPAWYPVDVYCPQFDSGNHTQSVIGGTGSGYSDFSQHHVDHGGATHTASGADPPGGYLPRYPAT